MIKNLLAIVFLLLSISFFDKPALAEKPCNLIPEITNRIVVLETLDSLIQAYENKNITKFMSNISEDYVDDDMILDSSVRKDFSVFNYISIRYIINKIICSNDKLLVGITFNRMLVTTLDGIPSTSNGSLELTFKKDDDGKLKLYSSKGPKLFGITPDTW